MCRTNVFFGGADGLEAVEVVLNAAEEFGGILVEQDVFVGTQAMEEAIAAGCFFTRGGAGASGFFGILAVGIDFRLAGSARLVRILHKLEFWRGWPVLSLSGYGGGLGEAAGV